MQKGKKVQKKNKELERRIAEEQRKLILKRKKAKIPEKKKSKPEKKDITDKLKSKKPENETLKQIDYHKFLESQQQKLDYASMFSYLGGSVKGPEYTYGGGASEIIKAINKKYETITWEEVKAVTDEEKMNQVMGLNRNFEVNATREGYKWWKAFNKGLGEFLYQVSMT